MKKILLTLIISLTLFGCSKNEEDTTLVPVNKNKMKEDLIGTWKLVGYYDDIEDPETGTNYHDVENGYQINYNLDNTFTNSNNIFGTYTVSQDSILTITNDSNSVNPNATYLRKIRILTNMNLENYNYPSNNDVAADGLRYEKVTTP